MTWQSETDFLRPRCSRGSSDLITARVGFTLTVEFFRWAVVVNGVGSILAVCEWTIFSKDCYIY